MLDYRILFISTIFLSIVSCKVQVTDYGTYLLPATFYIIILVEINISFWSEHKKKKGILNVRYFRTNDKNLFWLQISRLPSSSMM